jgi:PAS domain S-box-containing protein
MTLDNKLKGNVIGVIDPKFGENLKKQYPKINIITVDNYDQLIPKVLSDELDGMFDTKLAVQREMIRTQQIHFFSELELPNKIIAVAQPASHDQKLIDIFDSGWKNIPYSEIVELESKWIFNEKDRIYQQRTTPDLTDEEQAWLKAHQEIRLGIDPSYPPFEFIGRSGDYLGMAADYLALVNERLETNMRIVPGLRWSEVIELAKKREIDAMPTVGKTDERSAYLNFTRPYINFPVVFMTRKDQEPVNEFSHLAGRKLAMVKDYFYVDEIRRKFPDIETYFVETPLDMMKALSAGEVDAAIANYAIANHLILKHNLSSIRVDSEADISVNGISYGIRKDWPELVAILDKTLASISDKEHDEIRNRWIAYSPKEQSKVSIVELTNLEKGWVKANPVIRVHNEMDWPPFDFNEDGEARGLSIDYMDLLASKVGLQVEYVSGPTWNEFLEMMKHGELDVMLNIVKTPERQKYLLYTPPYVENPNTILSKKDTPYRSLAELSGKTVAVTKGYFYEEILAREYPEINVLPVKDTRETMNAVSFGKADAALGEIAVLNYLINQHMMTDLSVTGEIKFGNRELSLLNIATRKDLPVLSSILRKGMDSIKTEEVREIKRKWLGKDVDESKTIEGDNFQQADLIIKIIAIVIGLIISVVLGFWLVNYLLTFIQTNHVWGLVLPVAAVILVSMLVLSITLPSLVRKNAEREAIDFAINTIQHFKILRQYYTKNVIDKAIVSGHLTPAIDHSGNPNQIPLPATMIHELSVLMNDSGLEAVQLYSKFPFSNRASRELNEFENQAWKHLNDDPSKPFSQTEVSGEMTIVRVGIADLMVEKACVDCHNTHPGSPKTDWKLGDVRGVLQVDVPINDNILWARELSNKILIILAVTLLIVCILMYLIYNKTIGEKLKLLLHDVRHQKFAMDEHAIVAVTDVTGTITYANDKFCEISGYSKEELIGQDHRILNSENQPKEYWKAMYRTVARGSVWNDEVMNKAKDEHHYWVDTTIVPYMGNDGKPESYIAIRTDITKRKKIEEKLKENEERLNFALSAGKLGTWLLDLRTGVNQVDNRYARMLGYEPEEFINSSREMWEKSVHADDLESIEQSFNDYVKGLIPKYTVQYRAFTKDGNIIWVEARGGIVEWDETGKPTRIAGTQVDITERKLAQEELKLAKDAAEAATEAKATFLASMSHEIRTPMNGVIGMVDLLRQTKLAGDQKQMLETISDSGQSLLTIINDILDFSKIEAGKMDLEHIPFSILDVVEGATQTIAANATKKGLRLITYIDPDLPQFVTGDPVRIRQIIINLGGNAIKFTKEGQVVIRADRVESNDDQKVTIRFSVIDQGIGLSDEGQAKLFQAYSQADSSTTREFGGTGLGLTICKTLTGLMGGEIGVNSKLGEGAEFFSIIPFNQSNKKVEVLKTTDLSGLRVLLINSNRTELSILQHYLEHWEITVETNDNMQSVVSHCQTALDDGTPFDVVVFGPQWTQKELIAVVDAVKEIGLKTRFVFLTHDKQQRAQKDLNKGVYVDVDPIRRATFISAVAVAAGRESPEVNYEEEVEDLTSVEKALSVEEARKQGSLILVAEDNATNRDVIGRQLNLLGYTCEMAEDGEKALNAWRSNNYGILLTDCNMPIMDGFELTNAIRKDEEGTNTHSKIIAITANALQGEAERCLESGMDDYMSKPIDMTELREKLHKWMPHTKETSKQYVQDEKIVADDTPLKGSNGPIDENALKTMFGDDEDMFREILVDFIEPSKGIIKEIQIGFEQHSAENVKQGAHKLKSSALSIGAIALGELCQILEEAGKNDDWDVIENGTPKLEELMFQVEEYISQL